MSNLILASTSPYRAALMQRLGLDFAQCAPNADETAYADEPHRELALRLAETKARSIEGENALVIGSDQVAVLSGTQLHKPGTQERARHQLQAASGQTITFYTSVALLNTTTDACQADLVVFRATLRELSESEIDRYVSIEKPLDCAGSFKWEKLGISLMETLEGNDPTALEGLPMIRLCHMLRNEGLLVP